MAICSSTFTKIGKIEISRQPEPEEEEQYDLKIGTTFAVFHIVKKVEEVRDKVKMWDRVWNNSGRMSEINFEHMPSLPKAAEEISRTRFWCHM